MKRKAAFFDWDGTLSCDGVEVVPENREAIHTLHEMGHAVLLCTGRSTAYIPPAALNMGFDGVVAGAGAYVRLGDRLLYRRYLPPTRVPALLAHIAKDGQPCVLEGEEHIFLINEGKQDKRFPKEWIRLPSAEDYRPYQQQIISKLTLHGATSQATEALLAPLFTIIRHSTYTEVLPRGCGKAMGMRYMLQALDIAPEDSWAFGDSFNDLDMLSFAGVGVAMDEAPDPVKAAADLVTAPAGEAGVAQAIYQLLRDAR